MRDYWTSHQDINRKMFSDLPLCYRVHFSYSAIFYLHHVQFHFGLFFPVFWFSSACNNNKQKRGLGVRWTEVLKLCDSEKLWWLFEGNLCKFIENEKMTFNTLEFADLQSTAAGCFSASFTIPSAVESLPSQNTPSTPLSLIKCLCNCKIAKMVRNHQKCNFLLTELHGKTMGELQFNCGQKLFIMLIDKIGIFFRKSSTTLRERVECVLFIWRQSKWMEKWKEIFFFVLLLSHVFGYVRYLLQIFTQFRLDRREKCSF